MGKLRPKEKGAGWRLVPIDKSARTPGKSRGYRINSHPETFGRGGKKAPNPMKNAGLFVTRGAIARETRAQIEDVQRWAPKVIAAARVRFAKIEQGMKLLGKHDQFRAQRVAIMDQCCRKVWEEMRWEGQG